MKFIDFFAGIGGIRLGMEQAGHKCVGFCEYDKYARTSYKAMYDTEGEWENHDIRTVEPYDVPDADMWTGGFPCQDVSIAGKQKGLEGERSGLFYEIVRLLEGRKEKDRPKWIVLENVKNLLSVGSGFDFIRVITEMASLGYDLQWEVLNSKDYGVPQNRERIFIVGCFGGFSGREIFPLKRADCENPCQLKEITQGLSDAQRIYESSGLARILKGESGGQGGKTGLYAVKVSKPYGSTGGVCGLKVKKEDKSFAPVAARDYKGISRNGGNAVLVAPARPLRKTSKRKTYERTWRTCFYTYSSGRHGVALLGENVRIRRLTPRECWRLQGFPDSYFDKAKGAGISDTQLYKQAGNSVTVNVARAIGEKLMEVTRILI